MAERTSRSSETTKPKVIVCDDAESASLRAANIFADSIRHNPSIVLGLATGGTPVGMYRNLAMMHREEVLDFSQVTTFNLDEYVGLAENHLQSYRYFMQQNLFDHVNVDRSKTHLPNGMTKNPDLHSREYESQIAAAGGIDLQLLGIGHNGHIAFNEPGSTVDSRTRVVSLSEQTIDSNARFFDSRSEVPRTAITQGIATILDAREIVLLATGESKAEGIAQVMTDAPNADCPASFLQLHNNVQFVLDRAAARHLGSNLPH